jgi:hypothetical protein
MMTSLHMVKLSLASEKVHSHNDDITPYGQTFAGQRKAQAAQP